MRREPPRGLRHSGSSRFRKRVSTGREASSWHPSGGPARLFPPSSRIATAIALPPLHPMLATPGSVFGDPDFLGRRVLVEVLSVNRKLRLTGGLDTVNAVRQGHVRPLEMVAVCFPVGRNMNKLGGASLFGKCTQHSAGELLTIFQQTPECCIVCNGAVIKKEVNAPAGGEVADIGLPGTRSCPR